MGIDGYIAFARQATSHPPRKPHPPIREVGAVQLYAMARQAVKKN